MRTLNFYTGTIKPEFAHRVNLEPGHYVWRVEQEWENGWPRDISRKTIAGPLPSSEYATMLADQYMHTYRNRGVVNRLSITIDAFTDEMNLPLSESIEHPLVY